MRATAVVVAHAVDGVTRFRTLRSDPPLLLRPTPDALQLVGGAAGPLGGDQLAYRIAVEAGASLTVRSVAASVVLPGREVSALDIDVEVADGAHLDWAPEPLISVTRSSHRQRTTVRLAPTATLRWRETLVLGRSAEEPGTLSSVLRIERAGTVLHHNELRVGAGADGWDGPAGLGGARAVVSEARVGPTAQVRWAVPAPGASEGSTGPTARGAVFRLADDAAVLLASGPELAAVRAWLNGSPAGGVLLNAVLGTR